MQLSPAQTTAVALFASLFLGLAILVYGRVIERLRREPGKVATAHFELPDLLVTVVLLTFLAAAVAQTVWQHSEVGAKEINADKVLPASAIFAVMAAALLGFLKYRGAQVKDVLGLHQLSVWRAGGWALLLNITAWPFVAVAGLITSQTLGEETARQPLVDLFAKGAQQADYRAMVQIVIAGVIIAPISEELLFRGYFFGVGKRYFGAVASGLATALLFAAVHANLASLLPLFVLALCLTLAYERTGSILVPIGMHALFNFTSFVALYLTATRAFK